MFPNGFLVAPSSGVICDFHNEKNHNHNDDNDNDDDDDDNNNIIYNDKVLLILLDFVKKSRTFLLEGDSASFLRRCKGCPSREAPLILWS